MSVRESSDDPAAAVRFTRWPGLLSLSCGILLGPVVALAHQQVAYASNMWVCGRGMRATMHIIPVLSLIVVLATSLSAYRNWRSVGGAGDDERGGLTARVRFLALMGVAISLFSALVILAQWLSLFVFEPCQRA